MTIKRTIIVPAILALSAAGSILVASTASATAASASASTVHATVVVPATHYYE